MVDSIKSVIMRRDGLTEEEADEQIAEAKRELDERLAVGDMPFNICEEYFGLEPDYIMDLM